jgi:hypothetical protein
VVVPIVVIVAVGKAFTVTTVVAVFVQLFEFEYVYVIVDVPAVTPNTTPVEGLIDDTALLDAQTPPAGVPDNVVVDPVHTEVAPVIETEGSVLMVIFALSELVPHAFVA